MNVPQIFNHKLYPPNDHNNDKSCELARTLVFSFFFHICIAAILSLYSGTVQTDAHKRTAYENIW